MILSSNPSFRAVAHGRRSHRLLGWLATTALCVSPLLPLGVAHAQVQQVIVGGEQPPASVEVFDQVPPPAPGEWPYNVKQKVGALKPIDPSTLPSRRVAPQLLQAARLQQSGLNPVQVREAMTTPAPLMPAPEIAGAKPDAPRDTASTLPPVVSGPLMAGLADSGSADDNSAPAAPTTATASADTAPTMAATETQPSHTLQAPDATLIANASSDAASDVPSIAPDTAAAADAAPVMPAPQPSSHGRSLFGGTQPLQVADATPVARHTSASDAATVDATADSGSHTLQAPGDAAAAEPVPDASPRAAVTTSADATPVSVAPLTSQKSAPRLLAHIGDRSHGTVERPAAAAIANTDSVPAATAPAPIPEPAPAPPPPEQTAAVLPAKTDNTPTATVPETPPAPPPEPEPEVQPAAASTPVVTPAPAAKPAAAPHRTFWNRLFGSEDQPTAQTKPQTPVAAPQPQPAPTGTAAGDAVSATTTMSVPDAQPVAAVSAAPVTPAADTVDTIPAAAATPAIKPERNMKAAHLQALYDRQEPAQVASPEPVQTTPPASEPAPAAMVVATSPQPAPQPIVQPAPVTAPAAVAVVTPPPAVRPQPSTWQRMFGSDEAEPASSNKPQDEQPGPALPAATPPIDAQPAPVSAPRSVAVAPAVLVNPLDNSGAAPLPVAIADNARAAPVVAVAEPGPVMVAPAAQPVMPVAPVAAPVPTFRVEAPSSAGAGGLVTPKLVQVTPGTPAAMPPAMGAAAMPATINGGTPIAQISFLPASQSIDSIGQSQLQAIAEAMQMGPTTRLVLNAYADSYSDAESRRISLNRALVVRTKLAELGIQPARIDVQALGNQTPSDIKGGSDRVDAILR